MKRRIALAEALAIHDRILADIVAVAAGQFNREQFATWLRAHVKVADEP